MTIGNNNINMEGLGYESPSISLFPVDAENGFASSNENGIYASSYEDGEEF